MTSSMGVSERDKTKKIRLYKNGDENFFGKEFVVNPRRTRDLNVFLQTVSNNSEFGQAIRSIHTPYRGTEIKDIRDLNDKADYVVVGRGRFAGIEYHNLEQRHNQKLNQLKKRREQSAWSAPTESEHTQVAGDRYRPPAIEAVSIFVFCNGDKFEPAKHIVLPPRMIRDAVQRFKDLMTLGGGKNLEYLMQIAWDPIYGEINQRLNASFGAVRALFTLDGKLVEFPEDIKTDSHYVAAANSTGFKHIDYGNITKPAFHTFLKPLNREKEEERQQFNSTRAKSYPQDSKKTRPHRLSSVQIIHNDGRNIKRKRKKTKTSKTSSADTRVFKAKEDFSETLTEDIPEILSDDDGLESKDHIGRRKNGVELSESDNRFGNVQEKDAPDFSDSEMNLPPDHMYKEYKDSNGKNDKYNADDSKIDGKARSLTPYPASPQPATTPLPNNTDIRDDEEENRKKSTPYPGAGAPLADKSPSPVHNTDVEEKENLAATRVQAFYRGYRARKDFNEKNKKTVETSKEENLAAIKIQAFYRGYLARKNAEAKNIKAADGANHSSGQDTANSISDISSQKSSADKSRAKSRSNSW